MRSLSNVFFFICCFVVIFYIYSKNFDQSIGLIYRMLNKWVLNSSETLDKRRKEARAYCRLPVLDPWDPTILQYLDPMQEFFDDCYRTLGEVTQLKRGKLFVTKNFKKHVVCSFRCLYPKDDYNLTYSAWKNFSIEPDCDIIEVSCNQTNTNNIFYQYLHTQIYIPKNNDQSQKTALKHHEIRHPDVHLIIFDSTSSSSIHRTMPKTVHYLREKYDAISFPYFNKVGLNSLPNAYAFLVGKYAKHDSPECNQTLENDQFISLAFKGTVTNEQEIGYKTLMSEDWALGAFNYPNCIGFNNTPFDHYMRPFQLKIDSSSKFLDKKLAENVLKKSCMRHHLHQLDYLKKFIDEYESTSKFSITWMSDLAHDNINGLYRVDNDYYKFFKEYMNKLSHSFIILMGDHGMRQGSIRETKIGEIEDNNPALFVTIPDILRRNYKLVNTFKENSKQLISHFDLYATLVDISKNSKLIGPFKNIVRKKFILHGSSLFNPLPQPRNCLMLNISTEHCMCQHEYSLVKNDMLLEKSIAGFSINWINNFIRSEDNSNLCLNLTLKENSTVLEEFEPSFHIDTYQITFEVEPSGGRFSGLVSKDYDQMKNSITFTLASKTFARLNFYNGQSDCVKDNRDLVLFCYCKDVYRN